MEYLYQFRLSPDKTKEIKEELDYIVDTYSNKVGENISTKVSDQYHLNHDCRGKYSKTIDELKSMVFECLGETDLYITNGWVVYGKPGGYHVMHRHNFPDKPNKDICTVTYLDVGKEEEYHCGAFYYIMNGEHYTYQPVPGDVLIFSPTIWHGTYPQTSEVRQTLNIDFNTVEEYFPQDFIS
tara:strand:- start:2663 stop:3208 length:546 start_codon:yes stop_codon:yes gene_type:complete